MKLFLMLFGCLLFLGCATTSYRNEYGTHKMKDNTEYESVTPNVRWEKMYPEGCSVNDFYEHFLFDEIVDVTVTEQVNETKLFSFVISKSSKCSFSGTGVNFKKNESTAQTQPAQTQPARISPATNNPSPATNLNGSVEWE